MSILQADSTAQWALLGKKYIKEKGVSQSLHFLEVFIYLDAYS